MMIPASEHKLVATLAVLGELTKRWEKGAAADDLALSAWVSMLREHPADIALWALNIWPRRFEVWPAWKPFANVMRPWLAERDAFRRGVERLIDAR